MTKKIAVLVNEDTMQRCSCGGCLKAYMNKVDSFERYADEDTELVGFTHSGGDLEKKLASFKKNGVTTIHLSTCTRGKNDNYESIARQCAAAGFDVVVMGEPLDKMKVQAVLAIFTNGVVFLGIGVPTILGFVRANKKNSNLKIED